MIYSEISNEYKEAFLEQFCAAPELELIDFNGKDINHFLKRLDTLKEKAFTEGFGEEVLFEILSYELGDVEE